MNTIIHEIGKGRGRGRGRGKGKGSLSALKGEGRVEGRVGWN